MLGDFGRGRGAGGLPAGGIRASQGTFSSLYFNSLRHLVIYFCFSFFHLNKGREMPVTQLVTPTEEHEGLQLKKTVFLGYCDVAAGGLYVVFCLYFKI